MFEKQFSISEPVIRVKKNRTGFDDVEALTVRNKEISKAKGFDQKIGKVRLNDDYDDLNEDGSKETLGARALREGRIECPIVEQIKIAKEIMGDREVMGPDEVDKAFGVKLKPESIPDIPFSKEALVRAGKLGQFLVLRADKAPDGEDLTMKKMNQLLENSFKSDKKGRVLHSVDWYAEQVFYTGNKGNKFNEVTEYSTAKLAWALTSKELIPNTTSKNYLDQTEEAVHYLEQEVFQDATLLDEYKEAIDEFNAKKDQLRELSMIKNQRQYEQEIGKLKINRLIRQSSVEAMYDILIYFQNNGVRLLKDKYARTYATDADRSHISIGYFDLGGVRVSSCSGDHPIFDLGVVFSRKF